MYECTNVHIMERETQVISFKTSEWIHDKQKKNWRQHRPLQNATFDCDVNDKQPLILTIHLGWIYQS